MALKGLFGVDAYAAFGAAFLVANLLFGLLVIPLAVWISKRSEARMKGSPLVQSLMRTSRASLTSAAAFLSSISDFEEAAARCAEGADPTWRGATEIWWRCRDLNPGHSGYEPLALTN